MSSALPLSGVKVVELTRLIAGPAVGRFLGTCGATVVHVESQKKLDFMRAIFPYKNNISGINRAGYFNSYNADKLGISLDLTNPKGAEIMSRLVMWADIFIESNTPGVVDRYGLSYEEVARLNPKIIMISTSQMGQRGPWAHYKGYGVQGAAMAGFHEMTGYADSGAIGPFGAYTDMVSPQWLIAAALAALEYRRREGKGQYIDHSQLEAGVHFLAPAILDYTANGRLPRRVGNRDSAAVPHGCFRCRGEDRWCAIAVRSDVEWAGLCRAMGHPAWAAEDRFATFLGRKKNEDELELLLEEWTSGFTMEEVMSRLQEAGVPAGIVARGEDLHRDPQLAGRGHFKMLTHSEIGEVPFTNPPFKLSKACCEVSRPAPCFGEHTEQVCREILGIPDEELTELFAEGIFE